MNNLLRFRPIVRLIGFHLALIAAMVAVARYVPFATELMPIDGQRLHIGLSAASTTGVDPLAARDAPLTATVGEPSQFPQRASMTPGERTRIAFTLLVHMLGTLLLMLPLTRVYMTVNRGSHDQGFVAVLMVGPICVTGVVMLIQDSLPLAFGLAALVAAIRFQIPLRNALDGIFMFAAICVALSSGVGYIGIAIVISAAFCVTCVSIFEFGYGVPALPVMEQHRPGVEETRVYEHEHNPN